MRLGKNSTEKDLSLHSSNAGCQGDKAIPTSSEKGPTSLPLRKHLKKELFYLEF